MRRKKWPVKLVKQKSPAKCWAAAAAMLLGKLNPVDSGTAKTKSDGGLFPDHENIKKFARSHGLVLEPLRTWTSQAFWQLFQRGPIMVMGNVPIYRIGFGSHAYVVFEMETDGTDAGTEMWYYDPKGLEMQVNYAKRIHEYPLSMYYLLRNPF
jgi:hypothetical protein